MQTTTFETTLGGKTLTAEFTDLTGRANGSVLLRYGETAVLVTAVIDTREDAVRPYLPLSVEFEEKFYAAGAILGSRFQRREGRPSDEAVLSARIVDRTIRPLFPKHLRHDVQVVVTVLAMGEDDPDVLGIIGASLALGVSDIPWAGPVGAVRLAQHRETGAIIINPTYPERVDGNLALEVLACGQDGTINMIETAAYEASEDDLVAMLEASVKLHAELESWQREIIAAVGKEKWVAPEAELPAAVTELFANDFAGRLKETLFSGQAGKEHLYDLKAELFDAADALEEPFTRGVLADYFEDQVDALLHEGVISEGRRPDGRRPDEVRPLFAKAGGVSPVLHGSGIFYRGETHIFSALTLAGPEAAQLLDTMEERETKKHFMHHYNFPPFSVGETGRVGGFNRRMIGHGALAEKALLPVVPEKETFPYTIRLVSETMSSNGSSSMGSVCASTLALMDGGVPITRPVAGIASGLMMAGEQYVLLTDIQGPEDEHGDMDFKVAGTSAGITAVQMDVKVAGIPLPILREALDAARAARLHILDTITSELGAPRETISPRAPEIISLQILPEQIGAVIGSGGKTINGIKTDTGVEEISIDDDGSVYITGMNGTATAAKERITALTRTYAVGETTTATITKLMPFGAFARLDPHNEGLIHISEVAPFRLESGVEEVLAVGETVPVVVTKVEDGKIGLSIKQADPEFAERKGVGPTPS
jgi:polyribonucleotide nucleotidyltransferase